MKILSLKIPDDLDQDLTRQAQARGSSKSSLVREALPSFLDRPSSSSEASFLDLAGDLAGCLEGPGDLSYNKDHMAKYGR